LKEQAECKGKFAGSILCYLARGSLTTAL